MKVAQTTILVANHDSSVRRTLAEILSSDAYHTIEVEQADNCFDACDRHQPHALVLDMHMPDLDLRDLCARLRAAPHHQHLAILVTTNAVDSVEAIVETGVDDWMHLPADMTELRLRMRQLLALRQLRMDLEAAERRAETSETRFETLMEHATEGIIIVDRCGQYLHVNSKMCEMTGYSREELLRLKVREIFPEEDRETQFIPFDEAGVGEERRVERRICRKDGQIIVTEISATALANGQFQGIVRDITQQKMVETALRVSEEKYRHLFEYANDSIFIVDMFTGQILDANRNAARRLGYTREELLGMNVDDIEVSDENAENPYQPSSSGRVIYEHFHRRKDNALIPIETSTRVMEYDGRRVIVNFSRDITQRRQAELVERDLRKLAEALRDTAESLGSTLELEEVFNRVLEPVARVIPCETANIMLIGDDNQARIVAQRGYDQFEDVGGLFDKRFPVDEIHAAAWMIENHRPYIVGDIMGNNTWFPSESASGMRSGVAAPIQAQGEVIGFIQLESARPGLYGEVYAERLQAFANQAGMAIQKARLYQDVQDHAQELEQRVEQRTAQLSEANAVLQEQIRVREWVETTLAEERNLLRTVIDNLPDSIYAKDLSGRFILANAVAVERLGLANLSEVLGKTDYDFFPDRAAAFAAEDQNLYRTGEPVLNIEGSYIDEDGQERWVQGSKFPLRDNTGQVIGLVGINRNITQRKQAEKVLAEERNLLRTVIDNLPDLVYVKDLNERFVMGNSALRRYFGVTREDEIIGKTSEEVTPNPPTAERQLQYEDEQRQVMNDGTRIINREVHYTDETGHERWYQVTKVPLRDPQGSITGLVGINHEITDLKQAEEQVLQILGSARCLMWYAIAEEKNDDFKWDIYISNEEAAQQFLPVRIKPGQTYTEAWLASRLAEDRRKIKENSRAALRNNQPSYNQEFRCQQADGSIRWLNEDVVVKPLTPGRWSLIGVCIDITERKRAEEMLWNAYDELEARVVERTAELSQANIVLKEQIQEREKAENALRKSQAELQDKTDSLTAINTIADTIHRSLDFQTVVELAMESIRVYSQVDAGGILLLDEAEQNVKLISSRGFNSDTLKVGAVLPLEGSLTGLAIQARKPITVEDFTDDDRLKSDVKTALLKQGLLSSVVIPLLFRDQVLGSLNLFYMNRHLPSTQEQETLSSIGKTIGLAIANAQYVAQIEEEIRERKRAEEAERQRNSELEILWRASLSLNSKVELELVLKEILHHTLQLVSGSDAHIFLYDGSKLSFGAVLWANDNARQTLYAEPRQNGLTYTVARTNQRIVVPDMTEHDLFQGTSWEGAIVGLPLRVSDQICGVMTVAFEGERHDFSETELRVLELLAEQAAVAVQNAQYIRQIESEIAERKRAEEAERDQRLLTETLRDVAAELSRTLDTEEVMDRILTYVARVVPHDAAAIMLIEDGIVRIVRQHGHSDDVWSVRFDLELVASLRQIIETGEPFLIADSRDYEGWVEVPSLKWVRANVITPIKRGGQTIGFISLDSATPGTFTDHHAQRLQTFANHAGIAFDNARLYDAVQRHASELEQRVAERTVELDRERAQLRAILDAMGEGVVGVVIEGNTSTRFANKAFTQLTGYTVDTWDNTLFKSADMTDAEYELFLQQIMDHIDQKSIWRGEIKLHRHDHTLIDVSVTVTAVKNVAGEIIGSVTIMRDISQEKLLQERQMRFIANASHELRTPLTNMITRMYLIRRQQHRLDDHLSVMEIVANRMKALIQDLLDLSRFERGMILMEREEMSLQSLVEEVIHVQKPEAELKRIHLLAHLSDDPLTVSVDPKRIHQVITNLVINAINYTHEDGHIDIYVERDPDAGDYARVRVIDTGIGISSEMLPYVFQPFFRATDNTIGTGLGLSIAYEIIELHEGEITVASEEGQGSSFTIRLPLAEED